MVIVCSVPSLSSPLVPDPDSEVDDPLSLSLSESQLVLEHELPSSSHVQIAVVSLDDDALDPDDDADDDPEAMVPEIMVLFLFRVDSLGRLKWLCLHEHGT